LANGNAGAGVCGGIPAVGNRGALRALRLAVRGVGGGGARAVFDAEVLEGANLDQFAADASGGGRFRAEILHGGAGVGADGGGVAAVVAARFDRAVDAGAGAVAGWIDHARDYEYV